ncbi:MAG TPA: SufE family protein [Chthoniobacterales bacterium]|jgi:cysteine desulfuration protein SufE
MLRSSLRASQPEIRSRCKPGTDFLPVGSGATRYRAGVTLAEKQTAWTEKYRLVPDPQERLAAIVGRKSRLEPLTDAERIDANLVPGCVSRVWLAGEVAGGALRLRLDAEAGIVRGLAAFLAEFYDGAEAAEAAHFQPTLLEDLGIARVLSPTRLHGLGKVCERIRALSAT